MVVASAEGAPYLLFIGTTVAVGGALVEQFKNKFIFSWRDFESAEEHNLKLILRTR